MRSRMILMCTVISCLGAAALTSPLHADSIRCDVYQNSGEPGDYSWPLYGSFYTDSIDFSAPWHPFGLTYWRADFHTTIYAAATGTYGFDYLRTGGYISACVDGACGSIPGVADWDDPYMDRWGGWYITAGYHTFSFETTSQGNPGAWWPDHGGALLTWDPGITYASVPEPATLSLLAIGLISISLISTSIRQH